MRGLRTVSSNSRRSENHFATYIQRSGLPIIRCACGAEILLIPDLSAMNRAIENHVAKHKKANMKGEHKNLSSDRIRGILVKQILLTASGLC
jgi:hypothetical protein